MKQRNMSTLLVFGALVVVTFALVSADLVGMAQNTNSSTTSGDTSAQNTNTNPRPAGRRRRGGRRGTRATNTNTGEMTGDNTNTAGDTSMPSTNDNSGVMASGAGMQGGSGTLGRVGDAATLDGTYTGTINYPDGNLTGDATLTINGTSFTLESGGNTQSGTLTTQMWPGYTAVSMRFGTETPAKIISLRARKNRNWLQLNNVGGERTKFSFRGRSS